MANYRRMRHMIARGAFLYVVIGTGFFLAAQTNSAGGETTGPSADPRAYPARRVPKPQSTAASRKSAKKTGTTVGRKEIAPDGRRLLAPGDKTSPTTGARAAGAPPNDDCTVQVPPISGLGLFDFPDLNSASPVNVGPDHESCALFGDATITNDVWYCWTAPSTGLFELATCNLTSTVDDDTKIAVYSGCACPATEARLLNCNDDACGGEIQSSLSFSAQAGQTYLMRIGYPSEVGVSIPSAGQFSISSAALPCTSQSAESCQPADQFAARGSNRDTRTVADNFTPITNGNVTEICWWGIYADAIGDCQGFDVDRFVVRYYGDDNGKPGALVNLGGGVAAEFNQTGPSPTLMVEGPAATGLSILAVFPEYEFRATHPPVPVTAGTCYWIEITNSVTELCGWLWVTGAEGAGDDIAIWERDGGDPPGYDPDELVLIDQAFCLDIELGDTIQECNIPLPNPCAASTNDCCVDNSANPDLGCLDPTCCELVCNDDVFCCTIAWDQFCAEAALDVCGDQCEPCPSGDITWVTPPTGTIDARQSRDVDNGAFLQGIDRIIVDGPRRASASCWEVCEALPEAGQPNNGIIAVSNDGAGRFTLRLRRRITPGAQTKVNYTSTSGLTNETGVFASLPGDANASNTVARDDISDFVNCCLNGPCVPAYDQYRCDLNHSNASSAADLLRLFDILNGAGSFVRAWENETTAIQGPCP